MKDKDFKHRIAYEVLIILGMLALLLFICRLWPILLLVILGIFVAALRLLFLSQRQVEVIQPLPKPELKKPEEPTEKVVQELAFSVIQKRITCLVTESFPQARWVWKSSQAKQHVMNGEDASILLNHAGGYREAKVRIVNLRVVGLDYLQAPEEIPEEMKPIQDEPQREPADNTPPNYEYLAFEWVDSHAVELNERCNEYIATGQTVLLIEANDLPDRESWPDICRELGRNGIEDCECTENGILINLTQRNCRKD